MFFTRPWFVKFVTKKGILRLSWLYLYYKTTNKMKKKNQTLKIYIDIIISWLWLVIYVSHVLIPRVFWKSVTSNLVLWWTRHCHCSPSLARVLMSEVGCGSGSGSELALDIDSRKVGRLVGPHCPPPIGHSCVMSDCNWSQSCNRSTCLAECM